MTPWIAGASCKVYEIHELGVLVCTAGSDRRGGEI